MEKADKSTGKKALACWNVKLLVETEITVTYDGRTMSVRACTYCSTYKPEIMVHFKDIIW